MRFIEDLVVKVMVCLIHIVMAVSTFFAYLQAIVLGLLFIFFLVIAVVSIVKMLAGW